MYDTEEKISGLAKSWAVDTQELTEQEFDCAIRWCKKHERYTPSKALFIEKAKAIPEPEVAYELAITKVYGHPVVYYTPKNITDFKNWKMLGDNDYNKKSRFIANYKILRDKILDGEELATLEYDLFVTEHYENKYKDAAMRDIRFYDDAYYGNPSLGEIGIRDKQANDSNFDSAKKILIVDDDECTRETLRYFCRELNYKAYVAKNIQAALAIYQKADLILLDINLPEIDGLEVCRQIRKHNQDIPIIGMTALTDFAGVDPEGKSAGLTMLYKKPLPLDLLRQLTNEYLTSA